MFIDGFYDVFSINLLYRSLKADFTSVFVVSKSSSRETYSLLYLKTSSSWIERLQKSKENGDYLMTVPSFILANPLFMIW